MPSSAQFTDQDVNILAGVMMDWENAGSPSDAHGLVTKGGDDTVRVSIVLPSEGTAFGKQLADVVVDSRFDPHRFARHLETWEFWPKVLPVRVDWS